MKEKVWNATLSPPPHLKSKKEGRRRGVEEKQQGWMGKRAFTDDCSPVWAAKVRTWTSFISLQGHCPWSEGSCHPAFASPTGSVPVPRDSHLTEAQHPARVQWAQQEQQHRAESLRGHVAWERWERGPLLLSQWLRPLRSSLLVAMSCCRSEMHD